MTSGQLPSKPQNDPANLKSRASEIQQKTYSEPGCAQIIHALRLVNAVNGDGGLELDDDRIFDDEISDILADNLLPIMNIDRALLGDTQSRALQFDSQGIFVDFLQKSASKMGTDCLRGPDNASSNGVDLLAEIICVHLRSSAVPKPPACITP